jgi:hypothetical protein
VLEHGRAQRRILELNSRVGWSKPRWNNVLFGSASNQDRRLRVAPPDRIIRRDQIFVDVEKDIAE